MRYEYRTLLRLRRFILAFLPDANGVNENMSQLQDEMVKILDEHENGLSVEEIQSLLQVSA